MESSSGITNIEVKAILNFITGGLSVLGCVWVFLFYSKIIRPRPISMKCILFLSISDFIFSIANLISPFDQQHEGLCTFEAIIRIFSIISSLFWSSCIALISYLRLVRGEAFQQDKFFKGAMIIGFVISILYAVGPLMSSTFEYGVVTFGCFVIPSGAPTQLNKLLPVMIFDGIPCLIAIIITVGLYFLIAKKFNELSRNMPFAQDVSLRKLFWYPAALFLAYVPSLIDNLLEIYNITSAESYTFTTIHILLTHSVGFTNALVYGLQRKAYYERYEQPKLQLRKTQAETPLYTQSESDKSLSGFSSYTVPKCLSESSCGTTLIQANAAGISSDQF